ncbi:hypothetical protein, partial [Leuconostoc mesenteroides]|uniref:hypothetical protein n=1 Tax=Leuconostoc mesenteroides TaxID=1245 RepID=UPI002361A862
SELKHTAEGFEATVTKVDNLAVGGRNLLLGTRDWTDNTRWNQRNTVTKETYREMVIASTGGAWSSPAYMMQNAGILQVGKTYTFSTYVRNTSDTDTNVAPYYEDGIVTPVYTPTSLPAHTDWFRVSITFKCMKDPTTSTSTLRWEGQNGLTNGQIQFAGYKLEEGTIATDWTPAPEDIQSDIAQVKVTADGISKFVRDSSGNISSNFQTALGKMSIITDSTLAASIKGQTATQISSAITDNNGKIISLINQDSSGVQIAGKNIILDGTVTVTNAFTVGQANIANGAIGTAQIGDASITSAKIIDLDVARLTGNTTQFIKSNWDSAYSNVSIDPDSILLNAKSGSTTLTSVSIGSLGMKIEMPGTASFLSDTMINSGGIAFHHAGGTYGSFGMLGNGFTTQYSPTGGAPLGITVGDGRNNDAANMAFGISVSQYAGQAPQLIWAGANTGKVSSSYRTWDNPAGFIIADNIKFSTWDNTASIVEFDSTITYRNWAPDQTYGYIDGNGTKRWFKVSGYTLNKTNKLVGIFGGDGANGIAFDQTGDVWFSNKGNSYSLHDMLAKLNML